MSAEKNKAGKSWKRILIPAAAGLTVLVLLVLYQTGFFTGEPVHPGNKPAGLGYKRPKLISPRSKPP